LREYRNIKEDESVGFSANYDSDSGDVPYEQYWRECQKEGADYSFYLPEEIDR
jgi:hypothetical protein